jgi:hypothetical protein
MKYFAILSLLFGLMSCGGDSGGGSKNKGTPAVENLRGVSPLMVEGTNFLSQCTNNKDGGNFKVSISLRKDLEGHITTTAIYNFYPDASCEQTSDVRMLIRGKGPLEQDNRLLVVNYNRTGISLLTQEMVNNFNDNATCGINDWVLMNETNVMDTDCGPNTGSTGYIYLDAQSESTMTIFMCDTTELNSECDKVALRLDPRAN